MTSVAGGAAGLSALSSIFSSIVSWAMTICQFIGFWFTFKKMGKPGWKGIIPFYNYYVLFDELWEKKKFTTYVILSACVLVLSVFCAVFMFICIFAGVISAESDMNGSGMILFFVMLALTILSGIAMMVLIVFLIVLEFKLFNRLARAFGKSTGFAVGMVFVAPVFFMILGFDKSEYYKPVYN